MKKINWKDMREQVSRLLIKWSMPTRQSFILELMEMWQEVPCCGHGCCCNKMQEEQEKLLKGFGYKKK